METVDDRILSTAGQLWQQSHDHEKVLHFLRQNGISKLDSIKTIREICSISLGEAKRIVTFSAEWRDTLESTAALHDELAKAAEPGRHEVTPG